MCEYALLPMATSVRSQREASVQQRNGRSVEISRFLGRVTRSIIDVSAFPDRTIIVDCDVLQADGSTRVASVMAASIALEMAQSYWIDQKIINKPFLSEHLYATSVGIVNNTVYVDIDFAEDNNAQADFNLVMTESGKLVEVLGGAEKSPVTLEQFAEIQLAAKNNIVSIKNIITPIRSEIIQAKQSAIDDQPMQQKKTSIFSLQNRLFVKETQ